MVSCDGSILMLIISISVQNATAFQRSNTHSTHRHTLVVNRNCTPTITNLLYLTQLHVSRIIRQRLDNPDRNPFHSLSLLQILILQYRFQSIHQQSKAFQGFKIPRLSNQACGVNIFFYILPRNFILNFQDSITMKSW